MLSKLIPFSFCRGENVLFDVEKKNTGSGELDIIDVFRWIIACWWILLNFMETFVYTQKKIINLSDCAFKASLSTVRC